MFLVSVCWVFGSLDEVRDVNFEEINTNVNLRNVLNLKKG